MVILGVETVHLAANLTELMRLRNLNTSQLSRLSGVGQPVIYRLAHGETDNPKIKTLLQVAQALGVTIDQLLGEAPLVTISPTHHTPVIALDKVRAYLKGDAVEYINEISPDTTASERSFAVTMADETMAPLIPKGATLLCDPTTQPQARRIVIVALGDEMQCLIRRLSFENTKCVLETINPAFPTLKLSVDEPYQIVATGVAVNYAL